MYKLKYGKKEIKKKLPFFIHRKNPIRLSKKSKTTRARDDRFPDLLNSIGMENLWS